MRPKILVTGGAGFIGSEFVRQAVALGYEVVVVDSLTYAADLMRLAEVEGDYKFYKADICDKIKIENIFRKERPQILVNFAASTHVDRSIKDARPFIKTNILGTQTLLDASRKNGIGCLIHISSDEVYGEIAKGSFSEEASLNPGSPYAASKVAADLLIKAYMRTYNFPAIIVRPCNNYGPWQYPEKLIPLTILKVLQDKKTPVYAKGENIREWLYVSDCVRAILLIAKSGRVGGVYNVGSGQEKKNIEVVREIISFLGKPKELIEFVKDRPGHDFRYSLNSHKLRSQLHWQPKIKFEDGLRDTVQWYLQNAKWLKQHLSKRLSIRF